MENIIYIVSYSDSYNVNDVIEAIAFRSFKEAKEYAEKWALKYIQDISYQLNVDPNEFYLSWIGSSLDVKQHYSMGNDGYIKNTSKFNRTYLINTFILR